MTTRSEIKDWLDKKPKNATHMIVVMDWFEHEDYPVYIVPPQSVHQKIDEIKAGNRIMEVYNFALPLEEQLDEVRAYNL